MNLLPLLHHLAAADSTDQPTARRNALAQLARTAAAALPIALGAVAQPALAQRNATQLDGLLTILQMAWLQDEFYARVLRQTPVTPPVAATLVPAALEADLTLIRTQQRQHINQIEAVLRLSGGAIPARPNYDFTGSGNTTPAVRFPNVFTSTSTMLAVAQALADAAVRTSVGQIPLLIANNELMDLATSLMAVQARHAAHLRILRQQSGASVKPWISGTDGGGPQAPATASIYAGEDNVLQLTTPNQTRNATTVLPATILIPDAEKTAAATEAFDEPLNVPAAQSIIRLFTA